MTYRRRHVAVLVLAFCLLPGITAFSQSTSHGDPSNRTAYDVTQIKGLTEAKPNIKGQLTLSDTSLLFANRDFKAELPFTRMKSVSIGNVQIETGGKSAQIARRIIPYGGGMTVATVTQKSADLLTIEYVDLEGGYHGVVFFVPKFSAKVLSESMPTQLSNTVPQECEGGPKTSDSVVVEPIAAGRVELPAEYRVLLYERLITELRSKTTDATYVRAGTADTGAGCPAMRLQITVTGFEKGNEAVRAATGPIGFFVGKTSVSVHIELTATDGHSVLAEDMTNNKRMDTESLGVTNSVAKAVSKKLRKLSAKNLAV